MSDKKPSVFISYSRKDSEFADRLAQELRKKGLDVWFDRLIPAGADWRNEIEDALKQADIFLLLLSPNSVSSQWTNFETGVALSRAQQSRNVRVVPVLIESIDPKIYPFLLSKWQYLDARHMELEEIGNKLSVILSKEGNTGTSD